MNNFQKLIVLVMVATGTLNTVSASLQIARQAMGIDGTKQYFEHYYVQTMFMMMGECLCMVAYLILKYVVYKDDPKKVDGDALEMNPLVLWPASALDIVGTSLGYMGLAFMKDAGFFQMLRVSPIIFCGLLSIPILKQKLKWYNWSGILVVCTGLLIKAIPKVMQSANPPDDLSTLSGCVEMIVESNGTTLSGQSTTMSPDDEEASSEALNKIIGIALVLVGEFFHGCQFVYEEKFITKYNLPPLKAVGIEGICGFLTLAVLLWPVYFIRMPDSLGGAGLGPDGRFEDAIDAFVQIFNGHNGGWLLAWTLGNMCSIAVFNFAGITVTKELSATTRAVLDQLRVVLIWAIFLIPFGNYLCRMQDTFHFTAPIGLTILIFGVFIYNDIIIMPAVRKYILKQEPEKDESVKETA